MKKRIIGAVLVLLIGIPLVIVGDKIFILACGILGSLALKEIVELKEHHHQIPDFIFFVCILDLLLLLFSSLQTENLYLELPYKYLTFTLISLFIPTLFYKDGKYSAKDAMYLLGSILFLALSFYSILFVRNYNVHILVYLILISIFTDSFALFVGKLIGKHKCSKTISPGKTWEGCIGGSIFGIALSLVYYFYFVGKENIFLVVLLTSLLSVIGQLGDLVFSKIKRENKIKDFSKLIPGHGGILDRLDSLIFIVLTYILFMGII